MTAKSILGLFIPRNRKVFFVGILLIIASLVYLGSFKDYSSLTRNAKTTPKEELPIPDKGESDTPSNTITSQFGDGTELGNPEFLADLGDTPKPESAKEEGAFFREEETIRYDSTEGVNKTIMRITMMAMTMNMNNISDYSYSDNHDALNNLEAATDIKPGHDADQIRPMPLQSGKTTDLPQDLRNKSKQIMEKYQTALNKTKIFFADLEDKIRRIDRKEDDEPLPFNSLNTSRNHETRSAVVPKRQINVSDVDVHTQVKLVRPKKQEAEKSKVRKPDQSSRSGRMRPIPPPSGFSTTFTTNPRLFPIVFNTLEDTEYNRKPSVCPLLSLRRPRELRDNASCIPREVDSSSCLKASKEYGLQSEPVKCSNELHYQLCSFKLGHHFSNQSEAKIKCDISECGINPVYVLEISPVFGILKERSLWKRFVTSKGLAKYLERYAQTNLVSHDFNFCFLACVHKEGSGFIEQLFTFTGFHKIYEGTSRDTVGFNLNIVVLDSVSRPHFYRALPKTVKALREIVHSNFYNASVFDFEVMQSTAAYTFHNIRALMSGKQDFDYSGGHVNETYGIDVLFGKFKKLGFYTLLQEDSCWYDSWGSLFTNNKYQGEIPVNKSVFALRWRNFQDLVKHYFVDDLGLSHASCEILKRYNTTNQFNHPSRVCFGGKAFAEHFLDYTESIYNNLKITGKPTRALTYTHLNTGHEITGTRIRQIDEPLSRYVKSMATAEDTLTILLSDHGPKTTKFSFHTMEGRAEKYDPFLFIIVPGKVSNALGLQIIQALKSNQNRLVTTLDLHKALMSLGKTASTENRVTDDRGIFSLIPTNRTCADLSIKPLAVCKCDHWETRFPDNDKRFTWLAEYALGDINNNIQEQFLRGAKDIKGYGNCQRLTGRRFSKIRQRAEQGITVTTMDIEVIPGNEIFEVQLRHHLSHNKRRSFIKMAHYERITIYRHFRKCVDSTVSLGLCVCNHSSYYHTPTKRTQRRWVKISSRKDILDIISLSNSFGVEPKIRDIHHGCLLLVYRNHEGKSTSFEISNICNDRVYSVRASMKNAEQYFFSRKTPFSILVLQRTIHFLLVVKRSEKSIRNFKLRINHSIKYL
ncbi:uncharacterized protein [Montipora foliosa]|uniref:uncharacterized protein n=1 Tax=Montipora foliosa TaxID=591990 RepID=UPI0035F18EFE